MKRALQFYFNALILYNFFLLVILFPATYFAKIILTQIFPPSNKKGRFRPFLSYSVLYTCWLYIESFYCIAWFLIISTVMLFSLQFQLLQFAT